MGRQISTDPLLHVVSFRLTDAQKLAATELAAEAGLSVAEYAKHPFVTQSAKRARKHGAAKAAPPARRTSTGRPGPVPTLVDPATYQELRRQGVNLNQITHQLNSARLVAPTSIDKLVEEIRLLIAPAVAAAKKRRDDASRPAAERQSEDEHP